MDADFRRAMATSMSRNPGGRPSAMEQMPVVDVGELDLSREPGQSLQDQMAGPAAATKFGSLHKLDPAAGRMRYMGLPEHELGIIGERPAQPRSVLAGLFGDAIER